VEFSGLAKVHNVSADVPIFGAKEVSNRLVVVLSLVAQNGGSQEFADASSCPRLFHDR
jgi:hypothetical protein